MHIVNGINLVFIAQLTNIPLIIKFRLLAQLLGMNFPVKLVMEIVYAADFESKKSARGMHNYLINWSGI